LEILVVPAPYFDGETELVDASSPFDDGQIGEIISEQTDNSKSFMWVARALL
jgi:hypothetical protein